MIAQKYNQLTNKNPFPICITLLFDRYLKAVFTPSDLGNRGNLGKDLRVHTLDLGEFPNRIFRKNIRLIFVDRRVLGTAN